MLPTPTDISQASAGPQRRGSADSPLLMAGFADVSSVPTVVTTRRLAPSSVSPTPDHPTPGAINTAGAAPTVPAGKNASSPPAATAPDREEPSDE